MRDEVVLHNWKMMKLDRSRLTWGTIDNYRFPNGITMRMHFGRWPVKITMNVEQLREAESILNGRDYKRKVKDEKIELSVEYGSRGEYLDLIWDIYSIGQVYDY